MGPSLIHCSTVSQKKTSSTPPQPSKTSQLRHHLRSGSGGWTAPCRCHICHSRPLRHLLHSKHLTRFECGVFGPTCPPNEITIVSLLITHGRPHESVAPAHSARQRRHHDISRNRSYYERRRDDEPLGHQHHHKKRDKGPNVSRSFGVAKLAVRPPLSFLQCLEHHLPVVTPSSVIHKSDSPMVDVTISRIS